MNPLFLYKCSPKALFADKRKEKNVEMREKRGCKRDIENRDERGVILG